MAAVLESTLDPEKEYEIVDGQPVEKAIAGALHGEVGVELIFNLMLHVKKERLGKVYGPDTTFTIGKNDRLPDIAFVSAARIPPEGSPEGKWPIAPDLAVEIISPNDIYEEVIARVAEYLQAGVHQVWVVSLKQKTITVYHSLTQIKGFGENDILDGGDVAARLSLPRR